MISYLHYVVTKEASILGSYKKIIYFWRDENFCEIVDHIKTSKLFNEGVYIN